MTPHLRKSPRSATTEVAPPPASPSVTSLVVPAAKAHQGTFSDALVDMLLDCGVQHAFGLIGGAIAPFCEAVERSPIRLLHFRHESGAAFAAIEASLASNRPSVVFCTTGPGLTNTLTGMAAARWEGARVIFVSGATGPSQRGRGAFQESSRYTLPISGLFTAGPLFHYAGLLDSPDELETVASRFAAALLRPGGFVAHLGLPIGLQTARVAPLRPSKLSSLGPPACDPQVARHCADILSRDPFVIWVGYGARHATETVRAFAERTGARVTCSPRAKGIFPEDHPLFLGVTGLGGHNSVEAYLTDRRPAHVLVLGTRLGEFTSFWNQALVPAKAFIHVDLDPEAFGAAFPSAETIGVQADVHSFVRAVLDSWPSKSLAPADTSPSRESLFRPVLSAREDRLVRKSFLMDAIQRTFVEHTDAVILAEAGNAFAFASHFLRFSTGGRYRASTGFGSMGHAVSGVLGAALARGGKAVAIAGDGSMLMQSEINTAVCYGLEPVWIVLNDARYGMIDEGMQSVGWAPFHTEFPRADFVQIARGMGADGIRVDQEVDLDAALWSAIRARGPFVVDVHVDPGEFAPTGGRNKSLTRQGINGRTS